MFIVGVRAREKCRARVRVSEGERAEGACLPPSEAFCTLRNM